VSAGRRGSDRVSSRKLVASRAVNSRETVHFRNVGFGLKTQFPLVAVLVGPPIRFVSAVISMRPGVRYEPGISEDEFKSYDKRTVSDLQAFLKSREIKFTRYQWLRESFGYAYFWEGIARSSVGPCIGIFIGCLITGALERRRSLT
jgi:hypothetical protein